MFTKEPHRHPYRLINFNKIAEWSEEYIITDECDQESLFINAFILESNNILIITSNLILVVSANHEEQIVIDFDKRQIDCCQFDYRYQNAESGQLDGFLIAC